MLSRRSTTHTRSRLRPYLLGKWRVPQGNLSSIVLYTLLLLYSNWCYQGLKKRVEAERLSARLQHSSHPHVPAEASGFLFSWGLDAHHRLGRTGGDTSFPQITLAHLDVASAAASRHTLLVTRSDSVWSMGSNSSDGGGGGHGSQALSASGQLGRTAGGWAPGPVLGQLQGQLVKGVAAGRYHSVAVTASGRVYTWGLNDWGQLGRPATTASEGGVGAVSAAGTGHKKVYHKDERLPRRRDVLQADAGSTAAAEDDSGGASATGRQPAAAGTGLATLTGSAASTVSSTTSSGSSSCTSGWSCRDGAPGLVEALANVSVVAVRAGRYNTLALDAAGRLWVWGYDGCATAGQLPGQEQAWRPRLVQGQLDDKRVVAFGAGYTFWLAATEDGALYSCDTQDDGYAGTLAEKPAQSTAKLGRTGNPHEPGRVLGALKAKSVVAVAAGRQHALVATSDGRLYSFGEGRSVLGREGPPDEPGLVAGAVEGQFVQHVAAGEYFSLAASDSTVFGFGSNAYLCTGTSNDKQADVLQPTVVDGVLGTGDWTVHGLAAGYQHALAIADQPGAAAVAKLRADALAAAGASAGAESAVEVVLTEQQQLERQQYQQAVGYQQQGRNGSAAEELPLVPHAEAHQKEQARHVAAGAHPPAATTSNSSIGIADGLATGAQAGEAAQRAVTQLSATSATPADYHWSYLAAQPHPPSGISVQEVWAAWKPSPWHDALAALSPDVFDKLPPKFNTIHKNPCFGGSGPELACLPYFNIIGVSKCGTTDLYHRLTLYKQVILPATNKGPHFFDECPYPPQGACQAGPSGDFQAYINLFSRAADLIRGRPTAITGEASSNTFTSANGIYLRGFRGDKPLTTAAGVNATMPALLREAQPYLRLILMLRNPITRYHSAYYYYRWWLPKADKAPTPDDFHQHAVQEVQQWRECVAASTVADCVRRFKQQQLIKGMYAEFLQDWLRHWPREQLLILRYEDYIAALPQHLRAVLAFLDVPQPEAATLAAMATAPVQNKRDYAPMRADTWRLLQDFYQPFNAALAQALGGDPRFEWLHDGAPAAMANKTAPPAEG